MGFLRRVLGSPPSDDRNRMGQFTIITPGWVETGDDLFWFVFKSPNDAFLLLLRDVTDDGSRGGYRRSGLGRYRLIEVGRGLRCDGRLERPNDGAVADNGSFIVADWRFGDGPGGDLHVFDANGSEILRRDCHANIMSTFIDPAGAFAAAQLLSNPQDARDDERFIMFDLGTAAETWSKPLEVSPDGRRTARPKKVEFDPANDAIWVSTPSLDRVRYGLRDGNVDLGVLRDRRLRSSDGFAILNAVGEELATGVGPARREILVTACHRASDRLGAYPRYQARAWRLAGETVEDCDPTQALAYWDRAIEINPKVGIGRRAAALRERLRSP